MPLLEVWATFDPMALYIRVSRLNEEGGFDEPHVIACQASSPYPSSPLSPYPPVPLSPFSDLS